MTTEEAEWAKLPDHLKEAGYKVDVYCIWEVHVTMPEGESFYAGQCDGPEEGMMIGISEAESDYHQWLKRKKQDDGTH